MNAANCYEQLTIFYPEEDDYKVYYAQALYQACLYEEALKVTVQIENPELQGQVSGSIRVRHWVTGYGNLNNFSVLGSHRLWKLIHETNYFKYFSFYEIQKS